MEKKVAVNFPAATLDIKKVAPRIPGATLE